MLHVVVCQESVIKCRSVLSINMRLIVEVENIDFMFNRISRFIILRLWIFRHQNSSLRECSTCENGKNAKSMMFYLPNPKLMLFLMEINVFGDWKSIHIVSTRISEPKITMKRLNVLKWRMKLNLHNKKTHWRRQENPEIVKNETRNVLQTFRGFFSFPFDLFIVDRHVLNENKETSSNAFARKYVKVWHLKFIVSFYFFTLLDDTRLRFVQLSYMRCVNVIFVVQFLSIKYEKKTAKINWIFHST